MLEHDTTLRREAAYLHRAFFCKDAPEEFLRRYVQAHELWDIQETPAQRALLDALVGHGLDAEAVEYTLRLRQRGNMLTTKTQIVHYLAECSPRRHADFIPQGDMGPWAWASLVLVAARTVRCLVKGSWTIRRHGLA